MSVAAPQFQTARCTRYRYRYSECSRCRDACPHEAIALSDEGAALDPARCRNCALCISACPTGAWAGGAFRPIDLLRQAIRQPAFAFACAPSGANETSRADALVPCLSAIDGGMLAYLGKRKIPVTLHGSDHCADCEHGGKGAAQLALNLEALALLREGSEDATWTDVALPVRADADHPAAGGVSAGRRHLFRRLIGRGVDEATRAVDPDMLRPAQDKAIRAGAFAVTERRELLQIVCERKDGRPFRIRRHEALPLAQLALGPGCTACEACFRACPTGAMRIDEDRTGWALAFRSDRCVACEVCMEVCQPRALEAEEAFDARPEQPDRVLHRLARQRCDRCDRFFTSSVARKTCPVCEDDDDAFGRIFG